MFKDVNLVVRNPHLENSNFDDACKLEVCIFMYTFFSDKLPKRLDDFFTKRSDIHKYHSRNNSDYNQTRSKKVFTDQAVRTTGPILWNALNDHLKNVRSIKQFRKKVKKFIDLNLY